MGKKGFHFITGLPRSGSTLLAAILNQNPRFHAGMTSPVGSLTYALRAAMSQNTEIATRVTDGQRRSVIKGIFDNYYGDFPEPVIFDTNRGWTARLAELGAMFSDFKMIATVRNPAWIVDSFETIMRKNPLRQSSIARGPNVGARAEAMMRPDGIVGVALGSLMEALSGPDQHRLLLIEYDALCLDPEGTLRSLYQFIGEPYFDHDFGSVEYQQDDFDDALQTPGLHKVSGPVKANERPTLLPFDVFQRLSQQAFWRDAFETKAAQVIVQAA